MALIENTIAPWAPFYVVYAILTVVIPLTLRTYVFGSFRAVRLRSWVLAIGSAVVLQAVGSLIFAYLYPQLLGAVGIDSLDGDEPFYSLGAALTAMCETAARRLNSATDNVQIVYLGFITLWAGFGEEIFYRGYMHGTLRRYRGVAFAAIVSALFFAVRHGTQLALLWPDYPWAAATVWVLFSFLVGLYLSVVYQRSGSLYLPITVHYVFNLIPFVSALLAPDTV